MQRVGLQPARYIQAAAIRYRDMKRHDISISLLGYDMITTPNTGVPRSNAAKMHSKFALGPHHGRHPFCGC